MMDSVALRVAAENHFGDTVAQAVAGPTGLFLILALGVATVFLIRSMNKRLKKLPPSFDSSENDDNQRPSSD